MKLTDCEVSHRHIRGHNVAFLFGPRALSDDERAELLAEWHKAYGPDATPAYASPAGWQVLAEVEFAEAGSFVAKDIARIFDVDESTLVSGDGGQSADETPAEDQAPAQSADKKPRKNVKADS